MKLTELRGKIVSESVITDVKKSNQVMGGLEEEWLGNTVSLLACVSLGSQSLTLFTSPANTGIGVCAH